MDVFYEESAVTKDAEKAAKKYKIVHILSNVFLALGIIMVLFGFNMPLGGEGANPLVSFLIWILFVCSWFFVMWFCLFKFKQRFNVSYDYVFVSGELRISKVININKRKLVTRLQSEEILQMGDMESQSFEDLQNTADVKLVVCTPNAEPMEGKFFMYIYTAIEGKKLLYVFECREELLMHVLRYARRSVLAKDYVMQEKKNKV